MTGGFYRHYFLSLQFPCKQGIVAALKTCRGHVLAAQHLLPDKEKTSRFLVRFVLALPIFPCRLRIVLPFRNSPVGRKGAPPVAEKATAAAGQALALPQAKRSGKA